MVDDATRADSTVYAMVLEDGMTILSVGIPERQNPDRPDVGDRVYFQYNRTGPLRDHCRLPRHERYHRHRTGRRTRHASGSISRTSRLLPNGNQWQVYDEDLGGQARPQGKRELLGIVCRRAAVALWYRSAGLNVSPREEAIKTAHGQGDFKGRVFRTRALLIASYPPGYQATTRDEKDA